MTKHGKRFFVFQLESDLKLKGGHGMPRYEKAILLYNTNAGQGDVNELLQQTLATLAPEVIELTLIQTQAPGEAKQRCKQLPEDIGLLIIVGGDGTVHECVNGLMAGNNQPTVAIVPAGTCNDLARSLQIPTVDDALTAIVNGTTVAIDIGQQNDSYFANFSGVGMIVEASKEIEAETKARFGKLGYIISAIRSIKEPKPFSYTITTAKGETSSGDAVMILAMNGQYIGTIGLFLKDISLSDGKLHLFIVKEAGFTLLKNMYSHAFTDENWLNDAEGIEALELDQFTLTCRQTLDVDSDGEINEQTPVSYTLHQQALTFITTGQQEKD